MWPKLGLTSMIHFRLLRLSIPMALALAISLVDIYSFYVQMWILFVSMMKVLLWGFWFRFVLFLCVQTFVILTISHHASMWASFCSWSKSSFLSHLMLFQQFQPCEWMHKHALTGWNTQHIPVKSWNGLCIANFFFLF